MTLLGLRCASQVAVEAACRVAVLVGSLQLDSRRLPLRRCRVLCV